MPLLVPYGRWTSQPTEQPLVAPEFKPGLTHVFLPSIWPTNVGSAASAIELANGSWTAGRLRGASSYGNGVQGWNSVTAYARAPTTSNVGTFSALIVSEIESNTADRGIMQWAAAANSGSPRLLLQNTTGATQTRLYWSGAYRITDLAQSGVGALRADVVTWDGTTLRWYCNGRIVGTYAGAGSNTGTFIWWGNGYQYSSSTHNYLGGWWDGYTLPQADALHLSADPWSMFERRTARKVYFTASAPTGRTASADITLGGVTSAATGTVALQASLASTLGALTLSSAGAVALKASGAVTLGAATVTSTGALAIKGTLSTTLGALSVTATGTLTAAGTGQAAITLGELTSVAAGALAIKAAASITLGALTVSATAAGGQTAAATADITLASLTLAAQGKLAIAGSGAITLGGLTASATGSVAIAGQLGVQLGNLVVSATGLEITPDVRLAQAAITLGELTLAALTAPQLTSIGNRRLRERSPVVRKGALGTGRVRKGGLPSIQ